MPANERPLFSEKHEKHGDKNRYKFQKLFKGIKNPNEKEQDIQINHFKYIIDSQNKAILEMIGAQGNDINIFGANFKKKWATIMKSDRHQCE